MQFAKKRVKTGKTPRQRPSLSPSLPSSLVMKWLFLFFPRSPAVLPSLLNFLSFLFVLLPRFFRTRDWLLTNYPIQKGKLQFASCSPPPPPPPQSRTPPTYQRARLFFFFGKPFTPTSSHSLLRALDATSFASDRYFWNHSTIRLVYHDFLRTQRLLPQEQIEPF